MSRETSHPETPPAALLDRIYASIRANEPVARLNNQDAALHPDNPDCLTEDKFNHPRIFLVLQGPLGCTRRWLNRIKADGPALRLGYDFLCDHNDIGFPGLQADSPHAFHNHCAKIIAGVDFRDAFDGEDADIGFRHVVQRLSNFENRLV